MKGSLDSVSGEQTQSETSPRTGLLKIHRPWAEDYTRNKAQSSTTLGQHVDNLIEQQVDIPSPGSPAELTCSPGLYSRVFDFPPTMVNSYYWLPTFECIKNSIWPSVTSSPSRWGTSCSPAVFAAGLSMAAGSLELVNNGYGIRNPLAPSKRSSLATKLASGLKKFLCLVCGKGFNDTFDLKRHTRTHTGVRPYKCEHCDKSFTQRCSLETHVRKLHGVRLDYGYKERRAKLYVCEDCGFSTSDINEHYDHIQTSHCSTLLRPNRKP